MVGNYYSDSERGIKPRIKEDIPDELWQGLIGLIGSELNKQSFAIDFPELCPDGSEIYNTNQNLLSLRLMGEISEIEWPLRLETKPDKFAILDLIQFCYEHIGEAEQFDNHSYYKHHHLKFNRQVGRDRFKNSVNLLFSRIGVGYELTSSGDIIRLVNPVFQKSFETAIFSTGDKTLDSLLEDARKKFLNPDPKIRREGLEKLWDAWERLKTIEPGKDKKDSTKKILDFAATEPKFRGLIESEAKELTRIGNDFRIRHSEVDKIDINESNHVDYLFYRMFSLINILLSVKSSHIS